MTGSLPILVYQMGKVGSKTIKASLDQLELHNVHVHVLSERNLHVAAACRRQGPAHPKLMRARQLRAAIAGTHGLQRWKVITLVREPVARAISGVFQNSSRTMPELATCSDEDAFHKVCQRILHDCRRFNEEQDHACTWFDLEMKGIFGLNVYAHRFDKAAGYEIYAAEKADVLLMRLESLAECCEAAFSRFLGIADFRLVNANRGCEKPYRDLYRRVLDTLAIPAACLEKIYASRYARHFYTGEEIRSLRNRWSHPGRRDSAIARHAPDTDADRRAA
jgi:hypothetical protein